MSANRILEVVLAGLGLVLPGTAFQLTSPDGRLVADEKDGCVRVVYDGRPVLSVDRLAGLGKQTGVSKVDRVWENRFGERRKVRDVYAVLTFEHGEVRAYDAGLAWKVESDAGDYVFTFEEDARCWPVSHAQGEYLPFRLSELGRHREMPGFAPVASGVGRMFNYDGRYLVGGSCEAPLVVEPKDRAVALGDAAVYGGARLRFVKNDAARSVRGYLEGPRADDAPSWKYVRVARTPADLYNGNDLLLNLSDGCRLKDVSWIRPGKVLRLAKLDTRIGHAAVDWIAAHGFDYLEIDAGWYGQEHTGDPLRPGLAPKYVARGDTFDLLDILAYAKGKKVPVILYVNRFPLERNHLAILDQLKAWGVAGVKYGFLKVGSAEARAWAMTLVRAAADRGLLVDIHDEMRCTGEQRTYPNLMTVEGIRGNEEMPSPSHNAALVFTRYLTGPGDYTPCYNVNRIQTSRAHQLAAAAAYFSPWQFLHWYSQPAQIPDDPALAFWREIPTVWDETKALQGEIGSCAVVARRSGTRWFVGALNAQTRRTFRVPLDFAAGKRLRVRLFRDADPASTAPCAPAACETRVLQTGEPLVVEAAANGGWAAIVEAVPELREQRVAALLAEGETALSDRLLMHWKTHAADVYVRDQAVVGVGGPRAPVPTVVFDGNRSHPTEYVRPCIEELPRREEDPRGLFLRPKTGGEKVWVPYGKTGCMINSVNTEILSLAVTSARMWEKRRDARFARLAASTLDVYLKGILHRNVATDLSRGHMQTLFGMQSMETIHDAPIDKCTELYAVLKPYLKEQKADLGVYQAAFRKWADVQIANGVADNNWDMMQLNFILSIALVLEKPDRDRYVDVVMNRSSVRNLSVKALAEKGFDPATGIWWECPGYSLVTLKDYAKFADRARKELGIDLFAEIPVLRKAFAAAGEYLYPDGMVMGFGDTHPGPLPPEIVKHGPPTTSPFFYAPNASWLVSRSGMDRAADIAFGLNAALGNHQHANGISLELYANGYRLGPDAGIGWTLYSGSDYREYYSRFMAHNTVMVNARSDHGVMKAHHPFRLIGHGDSWAHVAFREPATDAEQERKVIRAGRDYFVDFFRSRVAGDGEQWHDYYYHNLGDRLTLNGETEPTEAIAFVESGIYGLSYIQEKRARKGTGDLVARFDWQRPEGNVGMTVYMNGGADRTFIQALAPATEGLSRVRDPDYGITPESRTPCLVVRQKGEAWTRPFMAVFDPKGVVEKVEFRESSVVVTRRDGGKDVHEL